MSGVSCRKCGEELTVSRSDGQVKIGSHVCVEMPHDGAREASSYEQTPAIVKYEVDAHLEQAEDFYDRARSLEDDRSEQLRRRGDALVRHVRNLIQ